MCTPGNLELFSLSIFFRLMCSVELSVRVPLNLGFISLDFQRESVISTPLSMLVTLCLMIRPTTVVS